MLDSHSHSHSLSLSHSHSFRQVIKATEHLTDDIIPVFAKEFSGLVMSSKLNLEGVQITEELHSKGINMRYLGLVFQHVCCRYSLLIYFSFLFCTRFCAHIRSPCSFSRERRE